MTMAAAGILTVRRLVCLTGLVALGVSAAAGVAVGVDDDSLDDYKLAVGFYNKEEWKLAAQNFETFLKKHGQHPKAESARYYLGLSLVKLDRFQPARDILRNFVKDYPSSKNAASAGYWIGHCSFQLNDFTAAEAELAGFVKKAGDDPLLEWALPYLADTELRLKKPAAALEHFRSAIKAFPNGVMAEDIRFGLARCHETLKQPAEAIKIYKELAANRAGTRAAEALLNLGALYFDGGDFASAATAYETLEKQFPESLHVPQAQLNQGFARFQLRNYVAAVALFDKAAKSDSFAGEALLWKGMSLKSAADFAAAATVLQGAYEKNRDQPLAERMLFYWAESEERRGASARARELYLELVARFPKGGLADESLHAACLSAVNAGQLAEAQTLLSRFDREYPNNKLRLRQGVLKGRVLLAKSDFSGAARQFQAIVTESTIESTKQQARYFLGDALQKLNQHAQTLEATEPLAAVVDTDPSLAEFIGVHVLRAASSLALARSAAHAEKPGEPARDKLALCAAAVDSAGKYLKAAPAGDLAAEARAVLVLAQALAGNKPAAQAEFALYRKNHPQHPQFEQTLSELGTIAFSREDWDWAEALFGELVGRPKESRYHARALADLGWTLHKRKKFLEAAASFSRLLVEHPDDELVPEAGFMRGRALQDAGQIDQAQAAFAEAAARPGAAEPLFLAGLQSARLLARLKKISEADAAYGAVLLRFAKRPDADKVLDEWATLHYNAENFSRADELFRRLATDYPNSDLADNARLSLAESDLVAGKLDSARPQFAALTNNSKADETVQQRALFQLMQLELESKRYDDLRKLCAESLRRFPAGTYHWDAELKWAEADFQSGAHEAALDRLIRLKAASDDPELKLAAWAPRVRVMLAETQFRLKRYDDVATTVAEFRTWDSKSPLLHQAEEVVGRSLKQQAKFPEARGAFEKVLKDPAGKLTETAAKAQFHIAETYLFEKNFEAAKEAFLKVEIAYKFPEWQAPALFQAAACYEELGQWKNAAKYYAEVMRDYPASDVAPKARERLDMVKKRAAG